MNIGLLVSGALGLKVLESMSAKFQLSFVMTDKSSEGIKLYCIGKSIPIFVGNPNSDKAYEFYCRFEIDVLLSANYLFLIKERLIDLPSIIAVNIHGSLLPKYRGRTPHVWSIINNEKYAGITIHKIDTGCDTGEILKQIKVDISEDETGYSLLQKYNSLYVPLIIETIEEIEKKSFQLHVQNNEIATYFSKRTPEDGLINWNWHKERIRNWVRAQSYPYPGAFSFYNGEKIIIDKIEYTNYGFNDSDENGKIVNVEFNQPFVKTSNGVIRIDTIRDFNNNFVINEVLQNG